MLKFRGRLCLFARIGAKSCGSGGAGHAAGGAAQLGPRDGGLGNVLGACFGLFARLEECFGRLFLGAWRGLGNVFGRFQMICNFPLA